MNIRADEHVSPEIVDAVRHIILTPAFAFDLSMMPDKKACQRALDYQVCKGRRERNSDR